MSFNHWLWNIFGADDSGQILLVTVIRS